MMKRNVIYFVDEDAPARRANLRDLNNLLDNPEIKIFDMAPLRSFAEYDGLVASSETAAFILDQRMKAAVSYNGTDLAAYLRRVDPKVPIYILTGYADQKDDFLGSEYLVEYIIGKAEIEDPNSNAAKIVKARLLRHLEVFNDVRDAREQRFHDLLIKSSRETLSPDEERELRQLEGERIASVAAAEREKQVELDAEISKLKELLRRDRLL